jgi:hypothetical protein
VNPISIVLLAGISAFHDTQVSTAVLPVLLKAPFHTDEIVTASSSKNVTLQFEMPTNDVFARSILPVKPVAQLSGTVTAGCRSI